MSHIALLSDIYSNLTYNHGKIATAVLSVLAVPAEAETILQIGDLYRSCTWECILLKKAIATIATTTTSATVPPIDIDAVESGASVSETLVAEDKEKVLIVTPTPSPNSKALLDVVSNIPGNIIPFLQGMSCVSRVSNKTLIKSNQ